MKVKALLVICVIFLSCNCYCQEITPVNIKYFKDSTYNKNIKIVQNQSLKNFMETSVGLNKKRRGFTGYRVKIYAQNKQNSRAQANSLRLEYDNLQHGAYVTYAEPNFEVQVGDFMTRFEALALLKELYAKFPEAYVIKTNITYPKH